MKTASKVVFATGLLSMTVLLSVTALLSTVALAADKPNFTGEWVMDASKCEFGPIPPPDSMTRKVDHSDPALTVVQSQTGGPQGDSTNTMKYTTDGKENVNSMAGNDVKSKATWDGNSLVIASKLDMQGNEIALTSKWSLSADGKVLTDLWHIATPQGEFDVTYVLNKK